MKFKQLIAATVLVGVTVLGGVGSVYASETVSAILQMERERLVGFGGTSTPLTQEILDANYVYIPGDGWVNPRCQEVLDKIMLRQVDTMNRIAQRETDGLLSFGFNYYADYAARRMAQDRVHPSLRTPVSEAMFTYGFRVETGSNVSYRQFFLDKASLRAERPLSLRAGHNHGLVYRIRPCSYIRWMYENADVDGFHGNFGAAIANTNVAGRQTHVYFARGLNYYNGVFSHANMDVDVGPSREERLAEQEYREQAILENMLQQLRDLGIPENQLSNLGGLTVTRTTTPRTRQPDSLVTVTQGGVSTVMTYEEFRNGPGSLAGSVRENMNEIYRRFDINPDDMRFVHSD